LILHGRRELIVDQVGEVAFQQVHDGEGPKGRHQRLALLPDVATAVDRLHHRRVRRRSPDAEVFQLLDQRRLAVAIGGLGVVALGRRVGDHDAVALIQRRQDPLLVGQLGLGVVSSFDVGAAKAGELDTQTGGHETHGDGAVVTVDSH
jgi:hypothetical protein